LCYVVAVPVKGAIHVDNGAVKALKDKHTSLFSAGEQT
jgi:glutamate 5-kinase